MIKCFPFIVYLKDDQTYWRDIDCSEAIPLNEMIERDEMSIFFAKIGDDWKKADSFDSNTGDLVFNEVTYKIGGSDEQ